MGCCRHGVWVDSVALFFVRPGIVKCTEYTKIKEISDHCWEQRGFFLLSLDNISLKRALLVISNEGNIYHVSHHITWQELAQHPLQKRGASLHKPDQSPSHNASCISLYGTAWLTVITSRSPRSSALLIARSQLH